MESLKRERANNFILSPNCNDILIFGKYMYAFFVMYFENILVNPIVSKTVVFCDVTLYYLSSKFFLRGYGP